MLDSLRFSGLRVALPGRSPTILTERPWRVSNGRGAPRRLSVADPVPAQLYRLTDWGRAAERRILELGRWIASSTLHELTLPFSPASCMPSLRTMLDRGAAREVTADVTFAIDNARFTARVASGNLPVQRGDLAAPDIRFLADSAPPRATVFHRDADPEVAEVRISGDHTLYRRFVDLFNLPRRSQWVQ